MVVEQHAAGANVRNAHLLGVALKSGSFPDGPVHDGYVPRLNRCSSLLHLEAEEPLQRISMYIQ